MYWPDIVIVIIIALFTIKSAVRGIVNELASIIALIAGFFLASSFYLRLSTLFSSLIEDAGIRYLLSFVGIFVLVYLGFILLGLVGKKIMQVSLLSWLDHLAGSLLGFIKGTFIVCVILILVTTFLPHRRPFLQKSRIYPHLEDPMEIILSLVPPTLKENFREKEKIILKTPDNKNSKDAQSLEKPEKGQIK